FSRDWSSDVCSSDLLRIRARPRLPELGLEGARHKVAGGVARILALVEDAVDLLGDGHLDAEALRHLPGGVSGLDALGHVAEGGEDLGELAALAELVADGAVAGELAGAGQHEIADAGEAGEGLLIGAAGGGEADHLGEAAGDEGGARVVAGLEAVDDAGADGEHVLERAAELH